jgi:hypothetical protein
MSWVRFVSVEIFFSSQRPDQHGSRGLLSSEYWGFFPRGVKRQRAEAKYPSLSNSEVKNGGPKPRFTVCMYTRIDYWSESQRERDHQEDQDVGGWIILGWILERWDGVM